MNSKDNQDYYFKKIDVELKLYEMMHEKVMTNDKRAEAQCVQIYVSIAALLGFAGLVYDDKNLILKMAADFMVIYIIPLMASAAIESVVSILMRDTYTEIFIIRIENQINKCLMNVSNEKDKFEPVLGYESFQFHNGFRKDNSSNFDMYFLGILTLMIGIGIPICWLFINKLATTWKIFFFIEAMILISIIIYSLINLFRKTEELKQNCDKYMGIE